MSPLAREILDEVIQPTWTDAAVAILVFGAGTFIAGYELAAWRKAQEPKPQPEIRYVAPLSQWACTKREFAEYREACKQRAISSLTK